MRVKWMVLNRLWIICSSLLTFTFYTYSNLLNVSFNYWNLLYLFSFAFFPIVAAAKNCYKYYFITSIITIVGITLIVFGTFPTIQYTALTSIIFVITSFFSLALAVEDAAKKVAVDVLKQEYMEAIFKNMKKQYKDVSKWFTFNLYRSYTLFSEITQEYGGVISELLVPIVIDKSFIFSELTQKKEGWQISKYKTYGDNYFTLKVKKVE